MYELIEQHYRNHNERLVKAIARLVRGKYNAEDVVQEAYTNALQYSDSFKLHPSNNIEKWFYSILKNCIKKFNGEEKRRGAVYKEFAEMEPYQLKPNTTKKVILTEIENRIDKIENETVKYILTLYFLHQYKPSEIGELVPLSDVHIRQLIFNFKKEIKDVYRIGK